MLRILTFDEPLALILRIEGVLEDASTAEFHRAVSLAKAQLGTRKLLADVGSLKVQDRAAEIALLEARNAGIGFFAKTGRIAELLNQPERSGRRFRLRLYRLLLAALQMVGVVTETPANINV